MFIGQFSFHIGQIAAIPTKSPNTTSIPVMMDFSELNAEILRKLVCTAVQESSTTGVLLLVCSLLFIHS